MNSNRLLAIGALLTGIAVIAISQMFVALKMRTVEPLDGAHGNQAILAFEFARTPEELARVIGTDPPGEEAIAVRKVLDHADRLDFWYMAIYAVFLALSFALVARRRNRNWLLAGVLLGPLAALFDLGENLVLLELTRTGADVAALLPQLHLRTMLKWELLAILAAMFAIAFTNDARRWVRVIAYLFAFESIVGGIMLYLDPATYSPAMLYSIAAVWIWQIGYAVTALRRSSLDSGAA
jgi:hypothetical protein